MTMDLQRWSSQDAFVYLFVIDLVKISSVQFLSRSQVNTSAERKLKVTVLHDSKQKEIGEFNIIIDECTINKKINCRVHAIKPDDLGKLHVYIDQACSSGLTGHVAIDLKEFVPEQNQELLWEYPLSASELHGVPKLLMGIQCTCLQELKHAQDCESIEIVEERAPEVFLESMWKGQSLFPDDNTCHGHSQCMAIVALKQPNKEIRQVERAHEQYDSTKKTLQKLEGVLLDLDARLSNVLSTYRINYSGINSIPRESELLEFQNQRSKFEWAVEDFSECFVCSDSFSDMFEGISTSLSSCGSCSNSSDSSTSCDETEIRLINLDTLSFSKSNSCHSSRFSTANLLKLIFIAGISALGVRAFQKREKHFCKLKFLNS